MFMTFIIVGAAFLIILAMVGATATQVKPVVRHRVRSQRRPSEPLQDASLNFPQDDSREDLRAYRKD